MHSSGHSATFVGGRMFMFGGCQVTGPEFQEVKTRIVQNVNLTPIFGLVVNTVENNMKQTCAFKVETCNFRASDTKMESHFLDRGMDQVSADCFNDVSVLDTMEPCPEQCGGHGTCVDERYCQCTACEAQVMLQCYCR